MLTIKFNVKPTIQHQEEHKGQQMHSKFFKNMLKNSTLKMSKMEESPCTDLRQEFNCDLNSGQFLVLPHLHRHGGRPNRGPPLDLR